MALASGNETAVDWWALAGGGGSANGGNVTLDGTLGQPVTGVANANSLSLGAGYWWGEQPVQLFLPMLRK